MMFDGEMDNGGMGGDESTPTMPETPSMPSEGGDTMPAAPTEGGDSQEGGDNMGGM